MADIRQDPESYFRSLSEDQVVQLMQINPQAITRLCNLVSIFTAYYRHQQDKLN